MTHNRILMGTLALTALFGTLWAQAPEQGRPLRNLVKQADGHWSPYVAPAAAEGATVHTVRPGDTLWALAQQYLESPYLWPQVWEKNPYISNPHWIYPGDPILIETPRLVDRPVVERPEEISEEPYRPLIPLQQRLRDDRPPHRPLTLTVKELETFFGTDAELYGTGRLLANRLQMDGFIVGAEDERGQRHLGRGEVVYINLGTRQGVQPGARFHILRSMGDVRNPATGKTAGHFYLEPGTVKVLLARHDHSVAEIDFSTQTVYIGDGLLPFTEKPRVPRTPNEFQRFAEDNGKPSGNIVMADGDATLIGPGQVVYIDLGRNANLTPGQFCTVYRVEGAYRQQNEFHSTVTTNTLHNRVDPGFATARQNALHGRGLPRVVLGELVVLEVFEAAAKAYVVEARNNLELGSSVQLR